MPMPQFEPMSVSGILDRALRMYRDRAIRFIAIVAIVQVPLGLAVSIGMALFEALFVGAVMAGDRSQGPPLALVATGLFAFALFIVTAVVGHQISTAAVLKSISEAYLGGDVTVWQAYRFVLPKLLTLVGASILVGLICFAGYALCVVPGVILSLWYALTTPAIVMENLRAIKGMSRSRQLAKGNLGKIFLVFLIVVLIAWIVSFSFNYGAGYLARLIARGDPVITVFLSQLLQFIPQIIVMPFSAAATVLLYYDLRIRKEGFDLEMLAARLGAGEKAPDVPQPGA
jgi:hypothetical protein